MKEYESYERIGIEEPRSYYIPFKDSDEIKYSHGIADRRSSSEFISLDGTWQIKQHAHIDEFELNEQLQSQIAVPSCVQMHGYDKIQYINTRYPIPVMPPHVPYENPCWHYRRTVYLKKEADKSYYLNFEGVDSSFYLYINGKYKGYSQISHATSEFDITEFIINGENTIDVLVLKWCASTYLECQDKFRFSGIFRSVYLLVRPQEHITDYKFETKLSDSSGKLIFTNESNIDIELMLDGKTAIAKVGEKITMTVNNVRLWSANSPELYTLFLKANGEVIAENVGFREITVDGCVFKINGEAIKLKGVNRHDFNCMTAATVSLDDMLCDIKLMKSLNVNAVRTSHYPNCPEFYLLCDAIGIYVMDEADLEMHGACTRSGGYDVALWQEYAENCIFEQGIFDRHKTLVERDKNRTSVIMWSLGNESSFDKAFFKGAEYIRHRDSSRLIHYEGLQCADEKYYNSDFVDVVSMMYPSLDVIRERVLDNPEEKRPFVLCEYTHAMGNSCGDISEYWKLIYDNPQMMGGFVWEWADHAIKTEKGFLYGGDFGESEHDGNFCVDGLLTPDRKIKSSALEMKAVYGGKTSSDITDIAVPCQKLKKESQIVIEVNEHTGELTSIKSHGKEMLKTPMHINIERYIDNDRPLTDKLNNRYHLNSSRQQAISCERLENGYRFNGVMASNCVMPQLSFELTYAVEYNTLVIGMKYTLSDYVSNIPRVGFEFGVGVEYSAFSYIGFGPHESYCDKHIACEYGYYKSTARKNYDTNYIRPQEAGSHYLSKYLSLTNAFEVSAEKPFSFSVNPYTTKQLCTTTHSFELKENDFINVCLDLAMRGVGSQSCGPSLSEKYEIPKELSNIFRIAF